MKRVLLGIFGLLAVAAPVMWGQKAPQPKSQKEVDAIMAIQNAPDPDSRIA
ncbi:MAG: hypothetical protein IT165_17135, partial [Bryobacterales bacterium]|nr:hypothetical protein [Bryobacterales bacterium]